MAISSSFILFKLLYYHLGEVSRIPVIENYNIEQSSSDLKGPDLYGGNSSKAASKPQPPKTLSNRTSSESCITRAEETEALSTAKSNVNMHPPVDYQQAPTHPPGATMATVPIPFQQIHDYTGKLEAG